MLRTLKQCQLTLEFLASLKKEVKWHGRSENEAAHYCNDCEVSMCESRINSARLPRSTLISTGSRMFLIILYCFQVEVFNFLYVSEQNKSHVVHCLDCARKINPRLDGFVVLNQYRMEELMETYDNFQPGSPVSFFFI